MCPFQRAKCWDRESAGVPPRRGWAPLARQALCGLLLGALGCHTCGRVFLNPREFQEGAVLSEKAKTTAAEEAAIVQTAFQNDKLPTPLPPKERRILSKEEAGAYEPSSAPPKLTDFTPSLPPPVEESPIDLDTALSLAGVENPQIALAQEVVREYRALQMSARVLLVPNVTAGGSYDMHNGLLQNSFGYMRQVDRQSLYSGLGAGAVAPSSVFFPGIQVFAALADAIYAPMAASQDLLSRRYDSAATRNNVLLEVATAYLALLGAEGRLAVIRQSEADFQEVVRLTDAYARAGQGRQGDADRARTDALRLHIQEQAAEEEVAVASANLSRLLHLDPSKRLFITNGPIQVVQLVDPHLDLEGLVQVALHNRPEVGARTAAIAAARVRYRQERARPLLPLLMVGYSDGMFGGGSNESRPSFGNVAGRSDVDVMAVWTLQNAGFGNWAIQKERRAQVGEEEARLGLMLNAIRREVAEANSRSSARLREVTVAKRQVETALRGLSRDLVRIRGGQGLPIEVLNSANLLVRARQELLGAIVGYDQAQFQLFVSLGQPPNPTPLSQTEAPAAPEGLPLNPKEN